MRARLLATAKAYESTKYDLGLNLYLTRNHALHCDLKLSSRTYMINFVKKQWSNVYSNVLSYKTIGYTFPVEEPLRSICLYSTR